MYDSPDDLCPQPSRNRPLVTEPLAPPIYPATVYRCETPEQAEALLAGEIEGYVYSRDGHPGADLLAEKCARLHGAERAAITGSGMSALALAMLACTEPGEHILASNQLYGKSLALFTSEGARLGIDCTTEDPCDTKAVASALRENTRLLVIETIANPMLRVPDISALAELAHARGARLLVDNTFASPVVCRPLDLGADLVVESITKIMNGHSDVMLGMLGGRELPWQRIAELGSVWGMSASPIDCWLALRGIGTLALRVERASNNAMRLAETLAERENVEAVSYPGLATHIDYDTARRQFDATFGNMVTITLPGGTDAARRFIAAAERVPFCPSLGELSTTLTHPETTSHRLLSEAQRAELGIRGGTIRLSVGVESPEHVVSAIEQGLAGI